MRFLKKKIELKQKFLDEKETLNQINLKFEACVQEINSLEARSPSKFQEFALPMRKPRQKPASPDGNSKNIVKNYGKALCAFASSAIAFPYLENLTKKRGYKYAKVADFMSFIKSKKEKINSIESLRRLLIKDPSDNEEIEEYKNIFQQISIIFLKYFSVNWIFGGKLTHKNAHLKYRFKMLRRIQDPKHFTYLKTS